MARVLFVGTEDDTYVNCMEAGARGFTKVVWGGNGYIIVSDEELDIEPEDEEILWEARDEGKPEVLISIGKVRIEY